MKFKGLLTLILALILACCVLCACGGPADTSETPDAPDTPETPADTGIPEHEHVMEPDPAQRVEPTCTETGSEVLVCTYPGCTETETKRLLKIDHKAVNEATCTTPALCVCGRVMADQLPHTYGEPVETEGTCTEKGTKTYTCTVCGDKKETKTSIKHSITTVVDTTGKFAKDTCSLCGYEEKRINYTTFIKMDFETEDTMENYLNSHDGFTFAQGTLVDQPLITDEATGNRYGYFKNANFFKDENMVLFNTELLVIEFDVMFDRFVSTSNASIFTLLPNWQNSPTTFAWLIKVNAEREGGVKTPGELVTYPGVGRMEEKYINTGFVMEVEHWYHYTFVINWTAETADIYVGDTGSGVYNYVAQAFLDLGDSDEDGQSDITREQVQSMAFRFCDGGSKTAFFDNFHAYSGSIPSWATAEIDSAVWPN